MRIRGGTNGILSAIECGLCDPGNPAVPEESKHRATTLKGSDLRRVKVKESRRRREHAKRLRSREDRST